jgi:hypothetical protein
LVTEIRQADPAELESALGVWRAANPDSELHGHLERLRDGARDNGTRVFVAAEGKRLVASRSAFRVVPLTVQARSFLVSAICRALRSSPSGNGTGSATACSRGFSKMRGEKAVYE